MTSTPGKEDHGSPGGHRALPRWGVMLPSFDPYRQGSYPVVRAAQVCEASGFDSVWVGDHLAYHPPTLDPIVTLAAAAAVTERIQLGTAVMLLALRNPAWAAKQVASVDALAPGRVVLGVGVGGEGEAEFEAAGVPLAERGRRLDEAIDVVTRLLAGDAVDHPGPLRPIRVPRLEPVPQQVPPLIIGGRSDAALSRAARVGDGWMGVWMDPPRLAATCVRLAHLADEQGRPRPHVLFMAFVHVTDDPDRGWEEAAGLVRGQYGLAVDRLARWIHVGTVTQIAQQLCRYQDAGADGLVLMPMARDTLAQIEAIAEIGTALTS